jgi:hypothetical protein
MNYILKFIASKLKSQDFWLLILGSLSMYFGWQVRTQMRENLWKSYKYGSTNKGAL